VRSAADLMIAVVPPAVALTAVPLPALPASLVAHRDHPLAHGRHDTKALRRHLLLTVRGSDPRLELPTAAIEAHATVHLNDFGAKRAAVLAGIGYGWLPDALIADDLARGRVRRIAWTRASRHRFVPRLYHRGPRAGRPPADRRDRVSRGPRGAPDRRRWAYTGTAWPNPRRPVVCACGSGSTCGCRRCTAGWCWRCC
jgi:DNA-binding transcriptional LysR family regulator